jgi:hypothetical protein
VAAVVRDGAAVVVERAGAVVGGGGAVIEVVVEIVVVVAVVVVRSRLGAGLVVAEGCVVDGDSADASSSAPSVPESRTTR